MSHVIGRIRRGSGRARPANGPVRRNVLHAGSLQAKLKIGAQGDRYEREADSVAARVLAGHPLTAVSRLTGTAAQRQVQLPEDEPEKDRQPRVGPEDRVSAVASVAAVLSGLRGAGQPLPASTRAQLEPRFGADFSQVRVHTGEAGARAAQALRARAFTSGNDIIFGKGEYAPQSQQGRALLAHELTHVIQQRGHQQKPGSSDTAPSAPDRHRFYTPYLHKISPPRAAIGSRVTLTGWNFEPSIGSHDRVELNGVICPVTSWEFERSAARVIIVITIPQGARSGSLRVFNNTMKSKAAKFTVL